ncbi:hypothetical protein [Sanguibacter sp. HDW7]|uniref:hypothetical protein n=1 Tax=Sanguibacter sp. HDW7 TaxID=2714931 RepID=UPI00140B9B4D|nr:hypothetical protein [Sanguibacter sp. HDW7]QIK83576.1 hypothetical protein G7063_08000 [Sanguibacter sp. HDW7]
MRNPRKTWIAGTVIVSLVLVLAGWFLLVQPKRTQAAELNVQADGLVAANVSLAAKVATLRKQFAQLDDFKAELAALQVRLPFDGAVPRLIVDLDKLAEESEVMLTSASVGQAQEVATLTGDRKKEADSVTDTLKGSTDDAKKDDAKDDGTAKGDEAKESSDGTPSAEPSAKPKADAASEKLVAFTTTLTFYGTFNEASAYLDAIQTKLPRYFLVSNVEATSLEEQEVNGRKLEDGDVEYVITGAFYIFTDKNQSLDPYEEGETEIKLPSRKDSDNPFSRDIKSGKD